MKLLGTSLFFVVVDVADDEANSGGSGGDNLMGVLLNTGLNTLRLVITNFDANGQSGKFYIRGIPQSRDMIL